ncbi:unnamed protein product [Allacma fusca]|uniref:Uncharacterized protein n=1 Tax=Allacma fusca TaxID=39272 RepID=A0A8J2NN80_9HEXA|nr:unnamed protein product [Allacma fusca]
MAKLQVKRSGSIRQTNPFAGRIPETSPSTTPAWLLELKQMNSSIKNTTTSLIVKEIPVEVISTPNSVSTNMSPRIETSNKVQSRLQPLQDFTPVLPRLT